MSLLWPTRHDFIIADSNYIKALEKWKEGTVAFEDQNQVKTLIGQRVGVPESKQPDTILDVELPEVVVVEQARRIGDYMWLPIPEEWAGLAPDELEYRTILRFK